ncbi:MAG: DUF559 domain-containing protein [Chlorobi bacterium]|nr:DUF559 domain-containing protein [Chlorobiota bacterium]MCI0717355.1 DUF559 domain-containing protein [Chlorobiota bacterium]
MKKPFIPYNKKLKQLSRNLRNNSTLAEVLLWNELKAGKIRGYKFNRQKPIGNYIADFYCKKLNLVIEIDGSSHINKELKDIYRQIKLEKLKLKILRFEDIEVKQSLHTVLHKIERFINKFEKGSPPYKEGIKGGLEI